MRFAIHVAQDLLERVSFANYKNRQKNAMLCIPPVEVRWPKLATGECIICYANTMYWT